MQSSDKNERVSEIMVEDDRLNFLIFVKGEKCITGFIRMLKNKKFIYWNTYQILGYISIIFNVFISTGRESTLAGWSQRD